MNFLKIYILLNTISEMRRDFIIICLFSMLLSPGHSTPVLIWKAEVNPKPVFPQIEQQEFVQEIKPLLQAKTIIAFTYDKLRLRDFRCTDCFPYLSTQTPTFFYANVEKPGEALRSLRISGKFYIEFNGKLDLDIECQPGKIYIVALDAFKRDTNPMRRCDEAIQNVASSLICPEVAYIFMGIHEESSELSGHLYQSNKLSFYITELHIQNSEGLQEIEFLNMNVTGMDPKLTAELQVENSTLIMQFNVLLSSGYFEINSFKFNNTTYYVSDLYAPIAHSFSCGKITLGRNMNNLIFKRVQIQYDAEPHQGHFKFKDAWTCEGFTSPAIASGLFISAILVGILSVGIGMLMSVKPPTKFETPGGPVMHINVSE